MVSLGTDMHSTAGAVERVTASVVGGGKFANGAVSAAFVHMYNAMAHSTYPSKENFIEGFTKDVSRAYRALSMMVRSQSFGARGLSSLSYGQAYDRVLRIEAMNDTMGVALGSLALGGAGSLVARAGYSFAMTNPVQTMAGVGVLDNLFLGGTSPTNIFEGIASQIHDFNPWAVK
jgi:hypothetical protein